MQSDVLTPTLMRLQRLPEAIYKDANIGARHWDPDTVDTSDAYMYLGATRLGRGRSAHGTLGALHGMQSQRMQSVCKGAACQ